ncbi:MAG: hypothetical protein EPN91_03010 [Salinibacterium sp.]|nr:MAG: hypothetical protein EPN91_03010 [Salinibacterium sp.]
MPFQFRAERGSVTAEFAVALPAVVIVLAGCLSAMQIAGLQLRLQDAAASAARSVARGEGEGVAATRASRMVAGASLSERAAGDLDCVTLRAPSALPGLNLTASSCALSGGR